tara:strand:+ start:282 stop:1172 length:891 start_codon:yes stop_codon:yes gene_type:complete
MIVWYTDKIESEELGYCLYLDLEEGLEYWYDCQSEKLYLSSEAGERRDLPYEDGTYRLYKRCKTPSRVEDLTGKVITNFSIKGYLGKSENKRHSPLWVVACTRGRIIETTRSRMLQNKTGCGSCLNKIEDCGDYLKVDVSTELHKNYSTLVDKKWHKLFLNTRWNVYKRVGELQKHLYVSTNSTEFSSKSLHRIINNTPLGLVTDHISGDTLDNREINLRSTTTRGNSLNCAIGTNNTSGMMGVGLTPKGKYRAHIMVDRKQRHLGNYETFEEACDARGAAEVLYGFHENHGRTQK